MPELARADRHRVRMTAWSASFQLIGVILAGLAGLLIEQRGFVFTMLIYALAILPLLPAPAGAAQQPGRQIKAEEHLGFWCSIKSRLQTAPFWC